jgi:hypothetical protein
VTATVIAFADYLARKREEPTAGRPTTERVPITVEDAVEICLQHVDALTPWEQGFLASIRRQRRFSPKQAAVLQQIFDKLESRL